jgi:exopolyphosphatase/guanosine-5'-triphosphate,3'-diphosphate pyrophosphatase
MKIAILDFGTNTFNLLIAETPDNKALKIIHTAKQPVKLGKGGITRKVITQDAFTRGMEAIEKHYETIKEFGIEKVYAFATSAIRDAENGKDFVNAVKNTFNLYVNVIPGEREADFIYKGVRLSLNTKEEKAMILDIGGGSNEIIIADGKKIYWKESFNLGMARLLEMFDPSDPIKAEDITKVESFLKTEMMGLMDAVKTYKPKTLIGASGSFETLSSLLSHLIPGKYNMKTGIKREIDMEDYEMIHNHLLQSSIEERKEMPGMEPVRVEMIVLATVYINFIIKNCGLEKLIQTDYALKEGVIAEILNI